MRDRPAPSAVANKIYVSAVLGRDDEVLLVRREADCWALPTTWVEAGEWVRDALARGLRELGVGLNSTTYLSTIEDRHGLVLVFDVVVDDDANLSNLEANDSPGHFAWARLDQLDTLELWPKALMHALTADNAPWFGHDWIDTPGR